MIIKKQLLLLVMILLPMLASADKSGTCGNNLKWVYNEGTKTLTISGSGLMTYYDNSTYYSPWYSFRQSIEHLIIEEGVTVIGYNAFNGCSALTSVSLPNSLLSIGKSAFRACSNLASIIIPNNVTDIEDMAFDGCMAFTSLTIPANVVRIGSSAFKDCIGITSLNVSCDNLKSIGSKIFENCPCLKDVVFEGENTYMSIIDYGLPSIQNIVIKKNVKSVIGRLSNGSGIISIVVEEGNPAYNSQEGCNAIIENNSKTLVQGCQTSIIPQGVVSIGNGAFFGCTGLTFLDIPTGVTSIGDGAFNGCGNLMSIIIPNSVKSIGSSAFSDCASLTSVTIPEGVNIINRYLFSGCTGLNSVSLPNSIKSIGYNAFVDCKNLVLNSLPNNLTAIDQEAFRRCVSLTSITIPNNVISIGQEAFVGCTNLSAINIGSGVSSIGRNAFGYTDLSSILVNPENKTFDSRNSSNAIIQTSENCLIIGCKNTIIPDGIVSIGDNAFNGCSGLLTLVIPNGVTAIGNGAFSGCGELSSIIVPNSVNNLGNYTFSGCKQLSSVELSEEITTIPVGCFSDCLSLEHISLPSALLSIENEAFANCSSLLSVNIPSSVTSIGTGMGYTFINCSSLKTIIVPDGVTNIPRCAFFGCGNLESVELGSGITSIAHGAFGNCPSLVKFTCKAISPPIAEYKQYFTDVYDSFINASVSDIELFVPSGSIDLYKEKKPWMSFKTVRGIGSHYLTIIAINGGGHTKYNDQELFSGTFVFDIPSDEEVFLEYVPDEGYAVAQVKINGKEKGSITSSTFYGLSEDTEVQAWYAVKQFLLTYIVDGVKYKEFLCNYGWEIKPEAEPTKEGYTFSGWSEIPKTMPAHDVIITGSFTKTELGDANGDGVVDVADVVAIVNYILNKPGENFNETAADVNGDGVVNVADVVAVLNTIR